ncbi:MAG: hypothetical protein J6N51_17485 [Selenomonas sp.]|nr:hypothetical protein [Selenomonas sp.]
MKEGVNVRMRLDRNYRLFKKNGKFHIVFGAVLCNMVSVSVRDKFHAERLGDIDEQHPLDLKDCFNPIEMRILCAKLGRSICPECVKELYSDFGHLPHENCDDGSSKYMFLENDKTGEIHIVEIPCELSVCDFVYDSLEEMMDFDNRNMECVCQKFSLEEGNVLEELMDGEMRSVFNEQEARLIGAKFGRRLCGVCVSHLYRT